MAKHLPPSSLPPLPPSLHQSRQCLSQAKLPLLRAQSYANGPTSPSHRKVFLYTEVYSCRKAPPSLSELYPISTPSIVVTSIENIAMTFNCLFEYNEKQKLRVTLQSLRVTSVYTLFSTHQSSIKVTRIKVMVTNQSSPWRNMFFAMTRQWDKEKILNSYEEANLRAPMLYH